MALIVPAVHQFGCSSPPDSVSRPAPRPSRVAVAEVRYGALPRTYRYLGQVRAMATAELAAGAEGQVTRVVVREGDRVATGDVLLQLDPDLAAAQFAQSQAERLRTETEQAQAKRDAERYRRVGSDSV
ncbi:MAG: biotin/lipoyl-binding protein, partial [Myxococcota bacterium]